MKDLQKEIDSLRNGASLQLFSCEYAGPISVRKPIDIDGQGSTLWALKGPVLSIEADGVTLRNIRIEVTGYTESGNTENECALLVKAAKSPILENVEVRGAVAGLQEEEGRWSYPHVMHLGHLQHGLEHKFLIRISVPVPCRLKSDVSGVEIKPSNLKQGDHEIQIDIEHLASDTLLNGSICIITPFLKRRIMIDAYILSRGSVGIQGNGQILWEPQRWGQPSVLPDNGNENPIISNPLSEPVITDILSVTAMSEESEIIANVPTDAIKVVHGPNDTVLIPDIPVLPLNIKPELPRGKDKKKAEKRRLINNGPIVPEVFLSQGKEELPEQSILIVEQSHSKTASTPLGKAFSMQPPQNKDNAADENLCSGNHQDVKALVDDRLQDANTVSKRKKGSSKPPSPLFMGKIRNDSEN